MKKIIIFLLLCLTAVTGFFVGYRSTSEPLNVHKETQTKITATTTPQVTLSPVVSLSLNTEIKIYLMSKKSPLASEVDYLLGKKHWKLMLAISHIESQFCTRKLGNNCWGINTPKGYAKFATLRDAIDATDALITKWQNKGKWLTIEAMNCSYVVPCSPNWVKVTKDTFNELSAIETKIQKP